MKCWKIGWIIAHRTLSDDSSSSCTVTVFIHIHSGTGYEAMVVEESVQEGARIESEGYYATVKFVGEIPGTKGRWILDIYNLQKFIRKFEKMNPLKYSWSISGRFFSFIRNLAWGRMGRSFQGKAWRFQGWNSIFSNQVNISTINIILSVTKNSRPWLLNFLLIPHVSLGAFFMMSSWHKLFPLQRGFFWLICQTKEGKLRRFIPGSAQRALWSHRRWKRRSCWRGIVCYGQRQANNCRNGWSQIS